MQTKVPEITIGFWIVKLLTTAFGEAASDYVGGHGLPVVAGVATFVLLAAGLIAQLASRRYLPWLYWSVVALIAVFGTMVADVIHLVLSVPYQATTIAFAAILAAVLWSWHRVEGTLDIHSVSTTRRELFYWATVCASFALGTAAGDLLADALHLGFLGAAIVFTLAILIPAFGRRAPRLGEIAGFWCAYILTRPLGASWADWFDVSRARGGIGLGTGPVALVLGAAVLVGIVALALAQRRTARADQRAMTADASRRNAGPATSTPSR